MGRENESRRGIGQYIAVVSDQNTKKMFSVDSSDFRRKKFIFEMRLSIQVIKQF
jgi:hypothetical protein